jgi:hypothetical protein
VNEWESITDIEKDNEWLPLAAASLIVVDLLCEPDVDKVTPTDNVGAQVWDTERALLRVAVRDSVLSPDVLRVARAVGVGVPLWLQASEIDSVALRDRVHDSDQVFSVVLETDPVLVADVDTDRTNDTLALAAASLAVADKFRVADVDAVAACEGDADSRYVTDCGAGDVIDAATVELWVSGTVVDVVLLMLDTVVVKARSEFEEVRDTDSWRDIDFVDENVLDFSSVKQLWLFDRVNVAVVLAASESELVLVSKAGEADIDRDEDEAADVVDVGGAENDGEDDNVTDDVSSRVSDGNDVTEYTLIATNRRAPFSKSATNTPHRDDVLLQYHVAPYEK